MTISEQPSARKASEAGSAGDLGGPLALSVSLPDDPIPDDRLVPCPRCGGEGSWEVLTGYDPRDGSPTGWVERCDACDGAGGIEEECPLIDEDDLQEMAA